MRKHGWQLPYHPLQVVVVAVFLALGFAFYVFFAPFVGKEMYQYILMAIYTPLITCSFGLYIWCTAADPADPGVFKSKKYLKCPTNKTHSKTISSKLGAESTPSMKEGNGVAKSALSDLESGKGEQSGDKGDKSVWLLLCSPCGFIGNCFAGKEESIEQQISEDDMFYCGLCEVEVFKYSKHCRVCDKCVDHFDHHCRWLNNCIGKKNYRRFFTLLVSALLLLILQWSTGILVLICCFLERNRFAVDISSKLGSSFSLVPYIIVVALCTILAMIATLPIAQLFFFHILLIKKGISTYDYIVALREQEQEQGGGGQQSPQMSIVSSLTGMSSVSSFSNFHRTAWCTPPRLFLEDQFDVVPPETGSVSSYSKKVGAEEPIKRKNPQVKISPWALARLNTEDVSRAAAEARKNSKILHPISRRGSQRIRLPADLPPLNPSISILTKKPNSLAPLQHEARSAFQTTGAAVLGSSPESSLDSPDIHPFRVSSSGTEDLRRFAGLTSGDGYEASGGEDSDRVNSSRHRSTINWGNVFDSKMKAPSSSKQAYSGEL